MTHEQQRSIDVAMEILELAGITENHPNGTLRYYDDPWGGGLEVCYAIKHSTGEKVLTVAKPSDDGNGFVFLMFVKFVNGAPIILEYDKTTIWDFYLEACLIDVKEKQ